jgi:hypothetical protein
MPLPTTRRCAASLLSLIAVSAFATGCRTPAPGPAPATTATLLPAGALLPSPRLIIGRIIAVDQTQGFAIVEVATDAPKAGLVAGTELIARTLELRETAQLQVSPYLRARTLGAKIVAGQPSPGDEVVWLAP